MSLDGFSLTSRTPEPAYFEARWTPQNIHLRERMPWDYSLSEILKSLFTDPFYFPNLILGGLLSPLVGRLVVASRNFGLNGEVSDAQRKWNAQWVEPTRDRDILAMRAAYEAIPIQVVTPDHVMISGTFYRSRKAHAQDIPTVMVAQPNAVLYKAGNGVEQWLLERGSRGDEAFNLVVWDYRGTGESGGSPNGSRQLLLDGDAVYQYVQEEFHISSDNFRFYGRSLGGAVAVGLRALHPSHAPCVNGLSFNSFHDMIEHTDYAEDLIEFCLAVLKDRGLPQFLIDLITYIGSPRLLRDIAQWLLTITGWEFDVPAQQQAIGTDLLVLTDDEDEMIKQAGANRSVPAERVLKVTSTRHHMAREENLFDDRGRPVADRIFKHLMGN